MAYALDNPPALVYCHPHFRNWVYQSEDAMSVVQVEGYFSNAEELGMQVGDTITVIEMDGEDVTAVTASFVNEIAADGSADLADGTAITTTDSD